MGVSGVFCKHCVAAGLAGLEAGGQMPRSISLDEVRDHLATLRKAELVDLVIAEAREDERLLDRLRLRMVAGRDGVDLDAFRDAIDRAVDPGGFVTYAEAYDYSRTLDETIGGLRILLDQGHAAEAVELIEHCAAAIERGAEIVDDSDGYMGTAFDEIQRLHLEACKQARLEPVELAERLFSLMMATEYDLFYDAVEDYAHLLGENGERHYAELVRAEWGRLPALGPDDDRRGRPGGAFQLIGEETREPRDRFRLTHTMEVLAARSGDIEEMVAVLAHDLSSPYSFLRIAEAYAGAGRDDDALHWAERGLGAFPECPDHRLVIFVAEAHRERGGYERAAALMWRLFAERPSLESYRRLKPYAEEAGRWGDMRERAFALLRDGPAGGAQGLGAAGWRVHRDATELVRIHLWEGDAMAALRDARAGGCRHDVWLGLADALAPTEPWEAMIICRERVEPMIERKTKADYRDAVDLLAKIRGLMLRTGDAGEFPTYVAEIRRTHKRKRNLIKLLVELDGGS
ncbi:MAG TPA: hypothetical protein VGH14_05445 [Solirubrobacterales bacterium]|jgi:uncharacterized Zn finger protein